MNCGTKLPDEAGFCPKCGTKIEVPCCPSCGKEVEFDTDFCIYCGQLLKTEPKPSPKQDTAAPNGTIESESQVHKIPEEKKQTSDSQKSVPVWKKIRLITGLLGLAIIAVYWIFTNFSWASKRGPSEMWTNAMHVQSENAAREYLIEKGLSEEIQVDINQDDVTYVVNSAAWDKLSGLDELFSENPLPYLREGKNAYWYQYTAPFVVTLNGENIGSGTIYPVVIWNPKKGLTYQEIQSTGCREFTRFDLSTELTAQIMKTVPSSPKYGQWCYDPEDMITSEVEARLSAYNTRWEENYDSVTAVAAIEDSVESDAIADFALQFSSSWGLGADDMLLLIYNNGNSCYWIYSPAMEAVFGPDTLSNILDTEFEADPGDDSGDSALLNFFEALDSCYSIAYESIGEGANETAGSEYPAEDDSTFHFSSITGSWQNEAGENYLFIGYSDESRQDARAYFTMAQGFEATLSSLNKDGAEGIVMDYAGNIAYNIGIYGYKYWLEVTLQDADTGEEQYLKYFPADMENCPYDNPYFLDLQ